MNVARVDVRRLEIPLTTPYRLAFGPVTRYDTIIVELTSGDGERGFGEATLLTGYTDETIGDSWTLARQVAETLPACTDVAVRERLRTLGRRAPFTATAFRTALDMASAHPLLRPSRASRVPILGLLQGADAASLRDAFERMREAGFRTVKVKIGFDVEEDLRFVANVQAIVGGRAAIRVDANQGYTAAQAAAFIRGLDPAGIELFEQPCAAGDWSAHREAVAAASTTGLPLMLDESIYDVADIERAADECACAYVKVKLMKFVGLDGLVAAIERIRALGMRAVLGNGVACDVSCWMEACVAARHIDNAGEMNGFLKARRMLLARPLVCERGDIVIEPGVPSLDPDALDTFTRERVTYDTEGARCPARS
ncbi:MAG: mandelate racemase/muconate lactonizing enzyme family protein [Betaproteobacteria bacterium]